MLIVEPVPFDQLLLEEQLPPQDLVLQVQALYDGQWILPLAESHLNFWEEDLPREHIHVYVLRGIVALGVLLLHLELPLVPGNTCLDVFKIMQPRDQPQPPQRIVSEEGFAGGEEVK